jgi:prepilin-type N-terminal cleavage/methylation domain-containing protein
MKRQDSERQKGFTLLELMTALGIFLLVCGAAFTLLASSQQRYQTESQVLTSFQEARLALDQMVRDINDSGYPPPSFAGTDVTLYATSPFGWSPGYPGTTCTVGISCITPGDFDVIIETNPTPTVAGSPVQWIRYQLNGTTLMRGAVNKVSGDDPSFDTASALAPLVENVVNNTCPAQLPACQSAFPNLFPGGNPVPIFSYTCDTPTLPQPHPPPCISALGDNSPTNIRDVTIRLIVAAPMPDATSGLPREVILTGRGRRVNPNQ